MSDSDAVLSANLEFYRAFAARDYAAMNALWSRKAPVLCVHPGWPPLIGRAEVMESWRNILAHPEPTRVMCYDDRAVLYGDFAVVICEEELATGHLVATNMFVREGGRWSMVHHQSGALVARPHEARPQRRH
jgi:ketosteroid isomerase-like protein